jgi:CBS domain containing-hemolysin-like protein
VLFIAIPIKIFYVVFKLPISVLNVVGNGVLSLLGLHPASEQEMVHSVSELRYLMVSMEEAGVLGKAETSIASRAFNFGETSAGAVMTPRVRLEALPVTSSLADIQEWARNSVHRRLLIYQDSLDRIVGLIHIGDIFKASVQSPDEFNVQTLLRPVSIVPRDMPADTLLEELRSTRQHLVVVSDTHGGTAGIVTLEDLIGVLVGRFEEEVSATEQDHSGPVYSLDDNSVVLDGLMPVEEVSDLLGVPLDRSGSVRTLGGLVIQQMNRIPESGDSVILAGYLLQVESMDKRRVALVRVTKTAMNTQPTMGGARHAEGT